MTTEAQVNIAHKLYDARRVLRRLCREDYAERVKPWIRLVETCTADRDYLRTGMRMLGSLQVPGMDAGIAQLWLLAAVVELIEPDGETPVLE